MKQYSKLRNAQSASVILLLLMFTLRIGATDETKVSYPADYRSWQHVKTMVIQPGHPLEVPFGGIHHVYANPLAMHGLEAGRYVDGAIFVFDLLDYTVSDNILAEQDRKRIDVMHFDRSQYVNTGGWGYETFVGDSATERLDQDVAVACHACHTSARGTNFVFSQYRR